jgi:hypothetical protein
MTQLHVCTGCERHILSIEATCPFCSTAQPPRALAQRAKLPSGLGRSQRFALAAAAAGQMLAGCANDDKMAMPIPVYGAPFPDDAEVSGDGDGDGDIEEDDASVPER